MENKITLARGKVEAPCRVMSVEIACKEAVLIG